MTVTGTQAGGADPLHNVAAACNRACNACRACDRTTSRSLHSHRRRCACTLIVVETILSVIQVIIAVVLIFLVLMHSGKDTGLSGAFGVGTGTGPLGGGSMVERNLNRWTVFFAILFVLNTIVLLKKLV